MTEIDKVSDAEIQAEFQKRFRIADGDQIKTSQDVVDHLATFLCGQRNREVFVVVFLSGRNQIIKTEMMFEGTLTSSVVYPREVVKRILELNAAAVVLAHNHPSGNPSPSSDDRLITKKIVSACGTIDVSVHDHIIFTPGGGYMSMTDMGFI